MEGNWWERQHPRWQIYLAYPFSYVYYKVWLKLGLLLLKKRRRQLARLERQRDELQAEIELLSRRNPH